MPDRIKTCIANILAEFYEDAERDFYMLGGKYNINHVYNDLKEVREWLQKENNENK